MEQTQVDVERVVAVLDRVRQRGPLVHCLTNIVVAGFTANVLLAVHAAPAMVENAEEADPFARIADAVLVNLGTLSAERARAMRRAAAAAADAGTPWVLDPVAVGALEHRTDLAGELLGFAPAVVRGNASEVLALAGAAGPVSRGVDSTAGSHDAVEAAAELARRSGAVVAVSGAVDRITDGRSVVELAYGHELMTRVTGVGCALGALAAACCAVEESPLVAAASATAVLTVAGELAAERAAAPGSFAVALVDELFTLDGDTLRKRLAG